MPKKPVKYYSPLEESINVYSHGLGLLLSVVAFGFLMYKAVLWGNVWHVSSYAIYGTSMILLYAASTFYHLSKTDSRRRRLKIFDHAAIYLLIAGTYTPFCLVTLRETLGWSLFAMAWGMALVGIVLKVFFTGRFTVISTLAYVLMGWLIVFAIKPLSENLSKAGLDWLIAGGVSYTFGAVLYAIPKIKFNHAIFHVFVLLGSACHFISIYFYVLELK